MDWQWATHDLKVRGNFKADAPSTQAFNKESCGETLLLAVKKCKVIFLKAYTNMFYDF